MLAFGLYLGWFVTTAAKIARCSVHVRAHGLSLYYSLDTKTEHTSQQWLRGRAIMSRRKPLPKSVREVPYATWLVVCLLCGETLSTPEGERQPITVPTEHFKTKHDIDYRECFPKSSGYKREVTHGLDGSSHTVYESIHATEMGKGQDVVVNILSSGVNIVRSDGDVDEEDYTRRSAPGHVVRADDAYPLS